MSKTKFLGRQQEYRPRLARPAPGHFHKEIEREHAVLVAQPESLQTE